MQLPKELRSCKKYYQRAELTSSKICTESVNSSVCVGVHVDLFQCLFGNPFHPVSLNPTWLTDTAVSLATGIYDDRAFDRLPILADALQEAGCDSDDLLNHFRGPGPHVRGCWALDLVLGKE